jgi:beta-mannosidase
MARLVSISGERASPLGEGWELLATPPDALAEPGALPKTGAWLPATVPGTVAGALQAAGLWRLEAPTPLHEQDFWYRTRIRGLGPRRLRLHGLATLAQVWLDDRLLLGSSSMFEAHGLEIMLAGTHRLAICFRALGPALRARQGRPRWRPRLMRPGQLRFFRTTLLGHMPGWCPNVHAVGPWRPVELVEPGAGEVRRVDLRAGLEGDVGTLALELEAAGLDGAAAEVVVAGRSAPLAWTAPGRLAGRLRLPGIEPWWPHSHGIPALHAVGARIGDLRLDLGRTGFRRIERDVRADGGADGQGFALRVNGEPVFCRGACWSSADVTTLAGTREAYAPWLRLLAEAGLNMVRVGGTMTYEGPEFFALCDELGILVWQDFMLANLDYPVADPGFATSIATEARQLLDRQQASPSLAVLCGGSEIEQQAAMLGFPETVWRKSPLDELLGGIAAELCPDVPYIGNSPSGGPLPFMTKSGVTHYYGVGAYRRPLEDARRAEVGFASECLAFANVPDAAMVERLGAPPVHHPLWKERVPRDQGAAWDFEDVRDHYLALLYAVEPARLRHEDPARYLRLSRAVSAEVMAETMGEWRRRRSTCNGALVWLFQDLWPGAGWGIVDSAATPKAAWHGLRRVCRPVQLLLSDEGVDGLDLHLLNETASPVQATLKLRCLQAGEVAVVEAERELVLAPRGAQELPAATLLGRFFDVTYAYRFGPPAHDVTVATLTDTATGRLLAEACHFPQGRAGIAAEPHLTAEVTRDQEGWALRLACRRLAASVHVEDAGFRAAEEWFHLPPGAPRTVRLLPRNATATVPDGHVHALNAAAPVRMRPA